MGIFRKTGGEIVEKGTFWNFASGEKVKLIQRGPLPGSSGQSYFKAPPLVVLAIGPVLALVFLLILPQYAALLYEDYAEQLVFNYVVFDYLFLGIVLAGMAIMALRDIAGGALKVAGFGWRPGEAYLAGKKRAKKKEGAEDKKK